MNIYKVPTGEITSFDQIACFFKPSNSFITAKLVSLRKSCQSLFKANPNPKKEDVQKIIEETIKVREEENEIMSEVHQLLDEEAKMLLDI